MRVVIKGPCALKGTCTKQCHTNFSVRQSCLRERWTGTSSAPYFFDEDIGKLTRKETAAQHHAETQRESYRINTLVQVVCAIEKVIESILV